MRKKIMSISIKWFPPSWIQIRAKNKLMYIDPSYLKTYFKDYPKRIEFSSWPDPIDGLPEELERADLILVNGDTVWGLHENVGHFEIPTSATVKVMPYDGVSTSTLGTFEIHAVAIFIGGKLSATGSGYTGGGGGGRPHPPAVHRGHSR